MPNKSHQTTEQTRSEVSALASFGIPQEDIASYLGISKPTLAKHYAEELKVSSIKANAAVGKYLYRLASGAALKDPQNPASHAECSRSAMFWAKTRMGWRETNRTEVTGADGEELVIKWQK
jgi:biotin operon repressor